MTTYIIEASHLFRAGDIYQTQFFVLDVVDYLSKTFFPGEHQTIVLHGSTKEEQASRYIAALERKKVKVVRMAPIPSGAGSGRVFYKPTFYLHLLLGKEIPKGSAFVLLGFHNPRYEAFLKKYHEEYKISMAVFSTPSKKHGVLTIPKSFASYLQQSINLDEHAEEMKHK